MLKRWGMLVDMFGKNFVQKEDLTTSSTMSLLIISQTTTLVRFLASLKTQFDWIFAQSFFGIFSLLGGFFYSLSPIHIDTNELNKGLLI